MKDQPLILAIDTSCDDTSAAVTCGFEIWSNVIASQTELHRPYGGVFPTVAKQAHKENIDRVIALALKRAQVSWAEIGAIAVTQGPGLAPALEVGLATAKQLALNHHLPLIPVNHLEGHLLSVLAKPKRRKITKPIKNKTQPENSLKFPNIGLVVSGGHTLMVLINNFGEYSIIGTTLDDAAGECLDKIGRMLNLGYPAGPVIEQLAKHGNHQSFSFPLPMTHTQDFNFSFSGLKTFARNFLEKKGGTAALTKQEFYDFCASIQFAVFRHISYKLSKFIIDYHHQNPDQPISEIWLGGGVASNIFLRAEIRNATQKLAQKDSATKLTLKVPYTKKLCIDNAVMIGVVASLTVRQSKLTQKIINNLERMPRMELV